MNTPPRSRPGHDVPPWQIGRPQPAIAALAERDALRGRVLDVGCGIGEHALLATRLGLQVVGIDLDAPGQLVMSGVVGHRKVAVAARLLPWGSYGSAIVGSLRSATAVCS